MQFLWIRFYILPIYNLKAVMLGPETGHSNFWVVLVILCWIGCSSITQIANKEVLNEGQSSIILSGHSITMWTDFYKQNKAGVIYSCQYHCCSSSLYLFFQNSRIFVVAYSWFTVGDTNWGSILGGYSAHKTL